MESVEVSFAITVEFILRPGAMEAFRRLIDENARNSFDFEPGCQRFDVLVPCNSRDKIFLYEVYNDKPAFEAHLSTQHFLSFNRESTALVASKTISEFELACEASAPKEK
jgi:(4S)-4-hydroxy-5-phosphonooxypentane-2,3-dione isomerase